MYEFRILVFCKSHYIGKVLALKAHLEDILFLEFQFFLNVVNNLWCSCCCKCKDRALWLYLSYICYFEIRWTEVVSPLTYTVSFVYGYEANFYS